MGTVDQDPCPRVQDPNHQRNAHEPPIKPSSSPSLSRSGSWQNPNHGDQYAEREEHAKYPEAPPRGLCDAGTRQPAQDHHRVAKHHKRPGAEAYFRDKKQVEEEERRGEKLQEVSSEKDGVSVHSGVLLRHCSVLKVLRCRCQVPRGCLALTGEPSQHEYPISCSHSQIRHGRYCCAKKGVEVQEALCRLRAYSPNEEEDGKEKHDDKLEVKGKNPKRREASDVENAVDAEGMDTLNNGTLKGHSSVRKSCACLPRPVRVRMEERKIGRLNLWALASLTIDSYDIPQVGHLAHNVLVSRQPIARVGDDRLRNPLDLVAGAVLDV
mmetsp:Transcript_17802/g.44976  ORF Transcript_17802/g.44976 Transcript_17802/m.44976 type:complete len:324 (-) Transcript_17802:505-1476(-)